MKSKVDKPKDTVYPECVRIWLKEIHPEFTFTAVHGKQMKSIIKKIIHVCKVKGLEGNPEQQIASFQKMMNWVKVDSFYKSEDLAVIDSHFNKIVFKIQAGKTENLNKYSSAGLFSKYGHS